MRRKTRGLVLALISTVVFTTACEGVSWQPTPPSPAPQADAGTLPPPPPTIRCTPGATQACLGPGQCAGGQTCAQDGMSWGACVCAVTPPDAGPPPTECTEGSMRLCGGGVVGVCRPGTQTCAVGRWGSCVGEILPAPETCNGADDDCDGAVDDGVLNACGRCGSVPAETCNGLDDDCDGAVDENLLAACFTACGNGTATCRAGFFADCNAPAPRADGTCPSDPPLPLCGNGALNLGEACDPGIPAGNLGACPASCDDANPCTMDSAAGLASACTATCFHVALAETALCGAGRECRSGVCVPANPDIPPPLPLCGNGALNLGEACDPGIPAGNLGACPASCDDANPCTTDTSAGLAPACTATCFHVALAETASCGAGRECRSGVCVAIALPPVCLDGDDCDDTNACTVDVCVAGACYHVAAPATTLCRPSAGVCDLAESCNGGLVCPADAKRPAGYECRASAGVCDLAESCDGASNNCPADVMASASTVCRSVAGVCDLAENCSGASAACPVDGFAPSTQVCRASTRAGDPAESCTGASAACPLDVIGPPPPTCIPAAEICDGADNDCDGVVDEGLPLILACGVGACQRMVPYCASGALGFCTPGVPAAEVCDNADNDCDGATDEGCDDDGDNWCESTMVTVNFPVVCPNGGGDCDDEWAADHPGAVEVCDGFDNDCDGAVNEGGVCCGDGAVGPGEQCDRGAANGAPTSCCDAVCALRTSTFVCRPAADSACDVEERCGTAAAYCPSDAVRSATTVCRPSTGPADPAEVCDGIGAACPPDIFGCPGGCDDANPCTSDACSAGACTHTPAVSGTMCRAAAGPCDVAESCTGVTTSCPADAKRAAGFTCRASAGVCDLAESCDGASTACPADALASTSVVCRAAVGVCDAEETCTGAVATCPTNALRPASFICRPSAGAGDPAEQCTGSSVSCPSDLRCGDGVVQGAEECDDGNAAAGDGCEPVTCRFSCHASSDCVDGNVGTTDSCVAGGTGRICQHELVPRVCNGLRVVVPAPVPPATVPAVYRCLGYPAGWGEPFVLLPAPALNAGTGEWEVLGDPGICSIVCEDASSASLTVSGCIGTYNRCTEAHLASPWRTAGCSRLPGHVPAQQVRGCTWDGACAPSIPGETPVYTGLYSGAPACTGPITP